MRMREICLSRNALSTENIFFLIGTKKSKIRLEGPAQKNDDANFVEFLGCVWILPSGRGLSHVGQRTSSRTRNDREPQTACRRSLARDVTRRYSEQRQRFPQPLKIDRAVHDRFQMTRRQWTEISPNLHRKSSRAFTFTQFSMVIVPSGKKS